VNRHGLVRLTSRGPICSLRLAFYHALVLFTVSLLQLPFVRDFIFLIFTQEISRPRSRLLGALEANGFDVITASTLPSHER
jgi:hypothetical protein